MGFDGGFAMALYDWTELENLSGEIADSESRLAAARSTQNHGLVKLLERQISEAEKWRDRLLSQITARLTAPPGAPGRRRDAHPAEAEPQKPAEAEAKAKAPIVEAAVEAAAPSIEASVAPLLEAAIEITPTETGLPEPAPIAETLEGVATVWDQLTRADIERVKRELGLRRAELLSRHAEELRALDAQQTEIDTLEQTVDAFARKFNIAGGEVVVPFEGDRNSRGQARG
jgi:hypothetical protein